MEDREGIKKFRREETPYQVCDSDYIPQSSNLSAEIEILPSHHHSTTISNVNVCAIVENPDRVIIAENPDKKGYSRDSMSSGQDPFDPVKFLYKLEVQGQYLNQLSSAYVDLTKQPDAKDEDWHACVNSIILRVDYILDILNSPMQADYSIIFNYPDREYILNAAGKMIQSLDLLPKAATGIRTIEQCIKLLHTLITSIRSSLPDQNIPESNYQEIPIIANVDTTAPSPHTEHDQHSIESLVAKFAELKISPAQPSTQKTPVRGNKDITEVSSQKREEVLLKQEKQYIFDPSELIRKLREIIEPRQDMNYFQYQGMCTTAVQISYTHHLGYEYEPAQKPESTRERVREAALAVQYELAVRFNWYCPRESNRFIPGYEGLTYAAGRAIWALKPFSELPNSATTPDNVLLHESLHADKGNYKGTSNVRLLTVSLYTSLHRFSDNKKTNVIDAKECISKICELYGELLRLDPAMGQYL